MGPQHAAVTGERHALLHTDAEILVGVEAELSDQAPKLRVGDDPRAAAFQRFDVLPCILGGAPNTGQLQPPRFRGLLVCAGTSDTLSRLLSPVCWPPPLRRAQSAVVDVAQAATPPRTEPRRRSRDSSW